MWALLFTIAFGMEKSTKNIIIQNKIDCSNEPTETELIRMSKSYYESFGIWAGIFWLDKAENYRIQKKSPKEILFHLRYQYMPIPKNPLNRIDSGFDQRVFYFQCEDTWNVYEMGPFMSASFEE